MLEILDVDGIFALRRGMGFSEVGDRASLPLDEVDCVKLPAVVFSAAGRGAAGELVRSICSTSFKEGNVTETFLRDRRDSSIDT